MTDNQENPMPALDIRICPGCRNAIGPLGDDDPPTPPDGAVLSCARCSGLYLFDGAAWREPTASEREALLSDEDVVAHLSMSQEIGLWQQADTQTLITTLTPFLLAVQRSILTPDAAAAGAAETLIRSGFHSHTGHGLDELEDDDA